MTREESLVRAFADPARAVRYLALLGSTRGRAKLIASLAHDFRLNSRYATRVASTESNPLAIEKLLRGLGAPDICYCLSENPELDGREMPLGEALSTTVGYGMGTLISCVPGELAYYESEERGDRYVLRHAAA
jgi:hypothetical protein